LPVPDESIGCLPEAAGEIESAATEVEGVMRDVGLPTEKDAVERATFDVSQSYALDANKSASSENGTKGERDLIISFRAAFQGFVFSLVDSAPSELALASFQNVNVLVANWNLSRTTASTVYCTVTKVQVDNMLPNSPFPVALHPMLANSRMPAEGKDENDGAQADSPPILVIGISFAPRHKSGTVVSDNKRLTRVCSGRSFSP